MLSNEIHFDVIIPVFNSEDYLERALDSLASQTYDDWTAYLIDGNPDNEASRAIYDRFCHSHPDLDLHWDEQDHSMHPHLSGARNQAIAMGYGSHIALLDSDDVWYPEHLEELVGGWVDSPDAGIVCTVGEYDQDYQWGSSAEVFRRRFHLRIIDDVPEGAEWLLATHHPGLCLVPSVVSFKRALFAAVGGFPPVRYEEDVALFSLLLREGGVRTGEGGSSFKQVHFAGAWLDWLRDGHKVSKEMHTTGKERLERDRAFYSMRWAQWAHELISDPPLGFAESGWEGRCRTIIRGDWPW